MLVLYENETCEATQREWPELIEFDLFWENKEQQLDDLGHHCHWTRSTVPVTSIVLTADAVVAEKVQQHDFSSRTLSERSAVWCTFTKLFGVDALPRGLEDSRHASVQGNETQIRRGIGKNGQSSEQLAQLTPFSVGLWTQGVTFDQRLVSTPARSETQREHRSESTEREHRKSTRSFHLALVCGVRNGDVHAELLHYEHVVSQTFDDPIKMALQPLDPPRVRTCRGRPGEPGGRRSQIDLIIPKFRVSKFRSEHLGKETEKSGADPGQGNLDGLGANWQGTRCCAEVLFPDLGEVGNRRMNDQLIKNHSEAARSTAS
ncbi:unnamed protein product [Durusdinium trenchii]|uniref:Uncharacterized protein n=1 Tax=Durusdinium trenchii TaxID=1381693 RepID=A0ABP0MP74_9DINO